MLTMEGIALESAIFTFMRVLILSFSCSNAIICVHAGTYSRPTMIRRVVSIDHTIAQH